MIDIDIEDAKYLISLARKSIKNYLLYGEPPKLKDSDIPERLKKEYGVFISLYKIPNKELRGCIGFPMPVYPLYLGVSLSAIESAVNDPRFEKLSIDELNNVVVELSVLSRPEKIEVESPLEYPNKIKLGRDGLILRYRGFSSLLLPQVPVDYGWTVEEYLSHLCLKAGLTPDMWLDPDVSIYKFHARVFIEKYPNGPIVERVFNR